MQGKRTLVGGDLMEAIDLYRWGARVSDICMLYDIHKQTLRTILKLHNVKMRAPYAPAIATPKPHSAKGVIRSSRPQIRVDALIVDDRPTPDQLVRSSAHAQRDRRIEERRLDASRRSCPAAASECRYAFLRSDSRLPDLE
jgi:hypothetical protein